MQVKNSPLGKQSQYIAEYDKSLLFPLSRRDKRQEINIHESLPFTGYDIWNAYELSWLNMEGKPQVAMAEFIIPCESKNLIESKSLKLYLNSFNNTKFSSQDEVQEKLWHDISQAVNSEDTTVKLIDLAAAHFALNNSLPGESLDGLDITCDTYHPDKQLLTTDNTIVEEALYSDLLKTNCPVTGQPDWASVAVQYKGNQINHENLLKYIISFRNHTEFHEQCIERIFIDIMQRCNPENLTIYARYTRRGGLDINPIRTNQKNLKISNTRLIRQ